jgi:hypothetical protein
VAFNEAKLMYPEALINKASFPQNSCQGRVEMANKVSLTFDKRFCTNTRSHEQRCAIKLVVHWLTKKDLWRKQSQHQETQRGSQKRLQMKKEATPRNVKGLTKKDLRRKKRQSQKIQRVSSKRPLTEKRQPQEEGEALPKNAFRRGTIV